MFEQMEGSDDADEPKKRLDAAIVSFARDSDDEGHQDTRKPLPTERTAVLFSPISLLKRIFQVYGVDLKFREVKSLRKELLLQAKKDDCL